MSFFLALLLGNLRMHSGNRVSMLGWMLVDSIARKSEDAGTENR